MIHRHANDVSADFTTDDESLEHLFFIYSFTVTYMSRRPERYDYTSCYLTFSFKYYMRCTVACAKLLYTCVRMLLSDLFYNFTLIVNRIFCSYIVMHPFYEPLYIVR